MQLPTRQRQGFTLVELLVVIAIIAMLVTLLLPAVQAAREAARRIQCANHLKQHGLAAATYESTHGKLVPGHLAGSGGVTWMVLIMPFMELDNLYQQVDINLTWYAFPQEVVATQIDSFYCPSRSRTVRLSLDGNARFGFNHKQGGTLSDYAMNGGDGFLYPFWDSTKIGKRDGLGNGLATRPDLNNGVIVDSPKGHVLKDWESPLGVQHVTDGLSKTLLFGEKFVHILQQGKGPWGDGTLWSADLHPPSVRVAGPKYPLARSDLDDTVRPDPINMNFGSAHTSVCQFAFGDGSVHAISPSVNTTILGYLANRSDGMAIPATFE